MVSVNTEVGYTYQFSYFSFQNNIRPYTATVLASFSPSVSVVASVQGCDVIDQHVGQGIPAPIVTTVAHPKGAQRIPNGHTMPRFHTGAWIGLWHDAILILLFLIWEK